MKLTLTKFIFINGPAGSGKSTLAKLLAAESEGTMIESFASPIREMIWSVFFPEHILEKPFDLKDQKVKAAALVVLAGLYPDSAQTLPASTVRGTMIQFSESFMKPIFGQDIFGRLCYRRCLEQEMFYSSFIIDDSGFEPEAKYIISQVGADNCHLIRLHREGCTFSGDSRSYISLPGVQTADFHNDKTPDELLGLAQLEFGVLL